MLRVDLRLPKMREAERACPCVQELTVAHEQGASGLGCGSWGEIHACGPIEMRRVRI